MEWRILLLTILSLVALPFFVYILSKVQMLGWINGFKQGMETELNKLNGEKRNG